MHCMNMIKLISTYALKRYFVMSVPILSSSAASNWFNDVMSTLPLGLFSIKEMADSILGSMLPLANCSSSIYVLSVSIFVVLSACCWSV